MFYNLKITKFWNAVQFQQNPENYNKLIGATAIKTLGDFLQECQACFKWGGYVSTIDEFPENVKQFISENQIEPIFRSTSTPVDSYGIIPYNMNGDALRMGIQGDRPSGFRSIYMLLNGSNDGINNQAITGYIYTSANQRPSRTLLVARNNGESNKNGLKGDVIYVTRELQRPNKEQFMDWLQYTKEYRDKKDLVQNIGSTIEETSPDLKFMKYSGEQLDKLDAKRYDNWLDYDTPVVLKEKEKSEDSSMSEEISKQAEDDEQRRELSDLQKRQNEGEELESSEIRRMRDLEKIVSRLELEEKAKKGDSQAISELAVLKQQEIEEEKRIAQEKEAKKLLAQQKKEEKARLLKEQEEQQQASLKEKQEVKKETAKAKQAEKTAQKRRELEEAVSAGDEVAKKKLEKLIKQEQAEAEAEERRTQRSRRERPAITGGLKNTRRKNETINRKNIVTKRVKRAPKIHKYTRKMK